MTQQAKDLVLVMASIIVAFLVVAAVVWVCLLLLQDARAGVCAAMPQFYATGPACDATAQQTECRCSECITWMPPPASYDVTFYNVKRTTISTGLVKFVVRPTVEIRDEAGIVTGHVDSGVWCPAADDTRAGITMPQEGALYLYAIEPCNRWGCAPTFSNAVYYRAAPYAYTFRPMAQGNN